MLACNIGTCAQLHASSQFHEVFGLNLSRDLEPHHRSANMYKTYTGSAWEAVTQTTLLLSLFTTGNFYFLNRTYQTRKSPS